MWLTWGVGPSLRNWAHATPLHFDGCYMGGNVSFSMLKAPKGLGAALWLKVQVSEKSFPCSLQHRVVYISQAIYPVSTGVSLQRFPRHTLHPISSSSLHPPEYLFKRDPPDNVAYAYIGATQMTDADSLIQQTSPQEA